MHWVVVGNGNISKRHIRNVRNLWPNSYITNLITHRSIQSHDVTPPDSNQLIDTLDHLSLNNVYAAIICTPASCHVDQIRFWLEKKIPILVEKPLSNSLNSANNLTKYLGKKKPIIMVGYVLRFFSILKKLKDIHDENQYGKIINIKSYVGSYLPDWRPNIDYKKSVSASKNLGGGALLELSHEIDYVLWLFGQPKSLKAMIENTQKLEIDVEDKVDIHLNYQDDYYAHIHLNFLDKPAHRYCKIEYEKATVSANIITGFIEIKEKNNNIEIINCTMSDANDAYLEELREFSKAIGKNKKTPITLHDGVDVLKIISACRESDQQGNKEVYL